MCMDANAVGLQFEPYLAVNLLLFFALLRPGPCSVQLFGWDAAPYSKHLWLT